MPDPTTFERLRSLILSASELKTMTKWEEPIIREWLSFFENLTLIAEILDSLIDKKIEETPTDFLDGSIPFADAATGFLVEDNVNMAWDNINDILDVANVKPLNLSPSLLVSSDANRVLASVANLATWVLGTTNEITVTDNGDGTVTLSRPIDVTDEKLTIAQELILAESSTLSITAAGGITPTTPITRIQGSGGPVIVTKNPQIAAPTTGGTTIILEGVSDTNTVELNNGNGINIHGKAIIGLNDIIELHYNTASATWAENYRNFAESEKGWSFDSPSGATGVFYYGGFYFHSAADNDFNPVVSLGTANGSYAAHVFIVQAAGAGAGVDTVVRITGTSINDQGVRTPADTQDLTIDDAGAAGAYYETSKKWIGAVTLLKQSGPDLLCNYGFAKYWDNNNNDFKLTGVEAVWLGGANDAGANIGIRHHKTTGWTYNAGAAASPPAYVADMVTDHVTEVNIVNGQNGAWKRDNLTDKVAGNGVEGIIIEVTTSANRAFELGNILLRVRPD